MDGKWVEVANAKCRMRRGDGEGISAERAVILGELD